MKGDHFDLPQGAEASEIVTAAARLLWAAATADDERAYVAGALELLSSTMRMSFLAMVASESGRWSIEVESGSQPAALPLDLFANVLDNAQVQASGVWVVAPLDSRGTTGELLVAVARDARSPAAAHNLAVVALVLGQGLATLRQRHSLRRRTGRLEAILEIANRWHQVDEVDSLLTEIAKASTRLLQADRASIFLWDRHSHTLVGRPALGIEGGELRIPDNRGVVGQVVQTGESRRVDRAGHQDQIDRQVDERQGYQTRTLLCVPLRGSKGELFGAFEMINKLEGDFTAEDEAALVELAAHAAVCIEKARERERLLKTRRQVTEQAALKVQLIGASAAIEALRSTVCRVAATDLAVLILGENGSGKEVVSQSIHYLSDRRDEPFIAVNCAAISETLLESELFGHEKGAFTDAREARQGKFELAGRGTLFLDEIGDLSPAGQAKLLRVLEERLVVRVGGSTPIHTAARVIAATNQELAEMVRAKRFRQDLFFRLNVVTLVVPPLRERGDDILLLAEHFLDGFARQARRRVQRLSDSARRRLLEHTWPGNVRELRNHMERLAYLSQEDTITAAELTLAPDSSGTSRVSGDLTLAEATDRFQIDHIKQAVARSRQNLTEAARQLGMHRSNLYRKMRQLGMHVDP